MGVVDSQPAAAASQPYVGPTWPLMNPQQLKTKNQKLETWAKQMEAAALMQTHAEKARNPAGLSAQQSERRTTNGRIAGDHSQSCASTRENQKMISDLRLKIAEQEKKVVQTLETEKQRLPRRSEKRTYSGRMQRIFRTRGKHGSYYVFFLPPLFCQRNPAFWTRNLGKNRQISAKISAKIG